MRTNTSKVREGDPFDMMLDLMLNSCGLRGKVHSYLSIHLPSYLLPAEGCEGEFFQRLE